MVRRVEVHEVPPDTSDSPVPAPISISPPRAVVPLVGVVFDAEQDLGQREVGPGQHPSVRPEDLVLGNEASQLRMTQQPLGHALSPAVGDDASAFGRREQVTERPGARWTRSVDPMQGLLDPAGRHPSAECVVECSLDAIPSDHGAQVAERSSNARRGNPVDERHIAQVEVSRSMEDHHVVVPLPALRERDLDARALRQPVHGVQRSCSAMGRDSFKGQAHDRHSLTPCGWRSGDPDHRGQWFVHRAVPHHHPKVVGCDSVRGGLRSGGDAVLRCGQLRDSPPLSGFHGEETREAL